MWHFIKNIFTLIFIFVACCFSYGSVYQTETAELYKAVTETKNTGYLGDSYVNFDNEPGSYLELRVGMAVAGEQLLQIRFANGGASTRPMQLSLNDSIVAESVSFPSTGSWTNWDTLSVSVNLLKGIHRLKLTSTGNEGGPNIDQIEISGEQLPYYQLNLSVNGNGSILQKPDKGLLFKGQEINLIAQAGFSATFVEWRGDFSSRSDTLKFAIETDQTIEALFEDIVLEIPAPDFTMTGYATEASDGLENTTGGKGGEQIIIENLQQLISWGASRENNSKPEIVIIKGKIEASTTEVVTIKRGGNISILGDSGNGGGYGELKNISLNIRDYSNVIIRNLKMHEVFYPNDDLTIDHCHHVWIDHCELHSKIGTGFGHDTYDGLLDIKKGSHHVTVSWCYFHDHMKTVLIGHSDNNGDQDKDIQVTFHHNWFSNTDGRNPSLRFGQVHYFNNYLENISDYGFAVRNGAHAKIENCHFESVKLPMASDKFTGHGFTCVSGCIYSGSCSENDIEISMSFDCEFWDNEIPYSYQLEDAQTVSLSTQEYAGIGKIDIATSNKVIRKNEEFSIEKYFFSNKTQQIFVTINSEKKQKTEVAVSNSWGQKIFVKKVMLQAGSQQFTFPCNTQSKGIYFLSIQTPAQQISKKFIL